MIRALTQSWNDHPERASRPFSADRDGFVLAEGSWMFVLEEYEHAKARGARIYAEITGYGATCEAYHRVRMSESPDEPARAITLALGEAGISPPDVQYVSLHGTSTEMNDRVETKAIKLAFENYAYKIPMSGLKSQIGHGLNSSAYDVVLWLLSRQRRAGSLGMEAQRPGARIFGSEFLPHNPGPHAPRRPELRYFLEKVIMGIEKKGKPRGKVFDVESGVDGCLYIRTPVCERECNLLHRRRSRLSHESPRHSHAPGV